MHHLTKTLTTIALAALVCAVALPAGNAQTEAEAVSPHDLGDQTILDGNCLNDFVTGTQQVDALADTIRLWVDWRYKEPVGPTEQDRWQYDVSLLWSSWPAGASSPGDWDPDMITFSDNSGQTDIDNGRQQRDYPRTAFAAPGAYAATLTLTTIHSQDPDWENEFETQCAPSDQASVSFAVGPTGSIEIFVAEL